MVVTWIIYKIGSHEIGIVLQDVATLVSFLDNVEHLFCTYVHSGFLFLNILCGYHTATQ